MCIGFAVKSATNSSTVWKNRLIRLTGKVCAENAQKRRRWLSRKRE